MELPNTTAITSAGEGDGEKEESTEVDAKTKEDEEPSKIKSYFIKAVALGILIYLGVLYIQDHSWSIEK